MTDNERFDFFMGELLDSAVKAFRGTEAYGLLRERLDQMNTDCEVQFTEDAHEFALECFDLLTDVSGRQEQFVYRQGLHDCVTILKRLGVLA